MMETFKTITKEDFKWPYPKPFIFRPSQPPITTKPPNFFMRRPAPAYCHCDTHQYDQQLNQYTRLAEKENALLYELDKLNKKMVYLSNYVLDNPCDDDDVKMETIYQSDYKKRGREVPQYRKLIEAIDSKAPDPIEMQTIQLKNGYRDPTSFRYTAIIRPSIDPCPIPFFSTTPDTLKDYFRGGTGRTEYQDTFSKTGLGIMKNSQQYREPLPSSRRRYGDPCL